MVERRTITLPGKPMTWARARMVTASKNGKSFPRFYTPADREQRMGEIRLFWNASGIGLIAKPHALAMRCEFIFDRPDSHFGTGRNAGVLKERFRHARPPSGKNGGDLDNLVKLVKDSLSGAAYTDDAQIAELQATKRYAEGTETAETRITVLPLYEGDEMGDLPEPATSQLELAAA